MLLNLLDIGVQTWCVWIRQSGIVKHVTEKTRFFGFVSMFVVSSFLISCASISEMFEIKQSLYLDGRKVEMNSESMKCFGPIGDSSRPTFQRNRLEENRVIMERCMATFIGRTGTLTVEVKHVTTGYPVIGQCTQDISIGTYSSGRIVRYRESRTPGECLER
jgi:hypothetical protein